MSYEASLSKLSSPLKELVANAQADTGKTDADKADVVNWIDKVAVGEISKANGFSVSRKIFDASRDRTDVVLP